MHIENETEKLNPSGFKDSIELENTGEMKFYCIATDKKKNENNLVGQDTPENIQKERQ